MHASFAILCAIFVLIVFLLIPAYIYSYIEDWSFLNAFYYCFISLTTVGLGDYVPGDSTEQKHRHMYKIFSTIYLIIGVTAMVWLLQIFSETPDFNLYKYFSLSKDAILTSHRDTVHNAAVGGEGNLLSHPNEFGSRSSGAHKDVMDVKSASAKAGYNDLNREMSSNDDELILTNSGGSASQSQNYLSLNDIEPNIGNKQ
jgi:hypothetical protein